MTEVWPLQGGWLERLGQAPAEVEARSRSLALQAVDGRWQGADAELAAACVYASGDAGLASRLALGGNAGQAGVEALRRGAGVLVDVAMVGAGTRMPRPPAVAVDAPGAAELAAKTSTTRAAAGVAICWETHGRGGLVAVGNAPSALLAVLDLAASRGAPACVIATCPGFTLAAEAKAALAASGLSFLAVLGSGGGSGLAAAALNSLARLA